MRNSVFKQRALVEGARYAKDKMVFLRELCQNARDAGASAVRVTVSETAGEAVLVFEDNGCGMSFAHAERYLFTLYASSKEEDMGNAGKFGVGFWSVLLSSPTMISVESSARGETAWKVELSRDLEVRRAPSDGLEAAGTRVTVRYAAEQYPSGAALLREAERALKKYCRHLRRNTKSGGFLPVLLNGVRVDRPFAVDGPHYMTFDDGAIQGAVGLAESPSVSVFARGLLVWQGTTLDELRYGATRRGRPPRIRGLSPCFVLNGDRLNATLDRRAVIDDSALSRLRKTAEARMDEFVDRYLDRVSPPRVWTRLSRRIARRYRAAGPGVRFSVWGLLLGAVLLFAYGIWAPLSERLGITGGSAAEIHVGSPAGGPSALPAMVPLRNDWAYDGASVGGGYAEMQRVPLAYRPPVDLGFRIASLDALDAKRGVISPKLTAAGAYRGRLCSEHCLHAALSADATPGYFAIPLPSGYRLDPESVRLNGTARREIFASPAGDPLIRFDRPFAGQIAYAASADREGLTSDERAVWSALPPGIVLPPPVERAVKSCAKRKTIAKRVGCAVDFAAQAVAYDDSPETAAAYRRFFAESPAEGWLPFILTEKRGDCDVLNALVTVMLRTMGIPARLAAGPLGRKGVSEPGLHAWVEFEGDGIQTADAVAPDASLSPSAVPPGTAVAIGPSSVSAKTPSPGPGSPVADARPKGVAPLETGMSVSVTPSVSETGEEGGLLPRLSAPVRRGILGILLGGLFFAAVLWWSTGVRGGLHLSGAPASRRRDAAKMVAAAMAENGLWRDRDALLSRPLLKAHGRKRRISVRRALGFSASGRLYTAQAFSPSVKAAVRRGTTVLDTGDEVYQELAHQLPGAVSLDDIEELAPLRAENLPIDHAAAGKLIERVEHIVDTCGFGDRVGIRLSLSPELRSVRDISLPGVVSKPIHLVVVPAGSPLFEEALRRGDGARWGAATLLERLTEESDLLYEIRERILTEAARRLFEGRS